MRRTCSARTTALRIAEMVTDPIARAKLRHRVARGRHAKGSLTQDQAMEALQPLRDIKLQALRDIKSMDIPGAALCILVAVAPLACNAAAAASSRSQPVLPASPPKDDGQPAKSGRGGGGGSAHAAALQELIVAPLGWAVDRQDSVRMLLPDAAHWLRVKFWSTPSLVAFRYGKDHHAIVGGFVVHVPNENAPEACTKTFEEWAQPLVDAFDVEIAHDPPQALSWNGKIADVDSLVATTATLGMRDEYAAVYGTYPAWSGACLVLGVAVPARGELERAKAVRDRFAAEVLPKVKITAASEPPERF